MKEEVMTACKGAATTLFILGCLTGSCATLAWKNEMKEAPADSFQNRIKENAAKALYWTEKNLNDLAETGEVLDEYKRGSLHMLLRPMGRFECLGSVYRTGSWKTTFDWIIREEDYQTLRKRNMQIAFANTALDEQEYETFIAENAKDMKDIMEQAIAHRVENAWNKIKRGSR